MLEVTNVVKTAVNAAELEISGTKYRVMSDGILVTTKISVWTWIDNQWNFDEPIPPLHIDLIFEKIEDGLFRKQN